MRQPLTPWQAHVAGWRACTRCDLHARRSTVVLARGAVPCDVLFVGEAPGRSEDGLGKPFIGPAGQLLDGIIEEALAGMNVRAAFTNLLACIPLDPDPAGDGDLLHPRDLPDCVAACAPRLAELVGLARPRLIVRVGKDAQDYLEPGYRTSVRLGDWVGRFCDIMHPSAILQTKNYAQQSHLRRRAVVVLRTAAEELFG